MNNLIVSSGFVIVPPSGLTGVVKSVQLDTIVSSGNIRISGSMGSNNYLVTAITPLVADMYFLMGENVSVTPTSGICIVNYMYAGEPEAYKYAKAAHAYAAASGGYHTRWVGSTSGTYQPISGGFGG